MNILKCVGSINISQLSEKDKNWVSSIHEWELDCFVEIELLDNLTIKFCTYELIQPEKITESKYDNHLVYIDTKIDDVDSNIIRKLDDMRERRKMQLPQHIIVWEPVNQYYYE